MFGFGVALTPITLGVTALADIPGVILTLLLSHGGIAFMPTGESRQQLADQLANITGHLISLYL